MVVDSPYVGTRTYCLFINGLTDGGLARSWCICIKCWCRFDARNASYGHHSKLSEGVNSYGKRKVVIKKLNAIQDLGAIDILCTDKTGTLTQDEIVLEYPLDIHGDLDLAVLQSELT